MRPHHICVSVADIDGCAEWYSRVLGFRTELSFRIPATGARVVWLASAEGGRVELTESTDGVTGNQWHEPGEALKAHGVTHFGFEVEDVKATFAEAVARGAAAVWEPRDGIGGVRMAFIHDHEGNLVELLQVTSEPVNQAQQQSDHQ